VARLWRRPLGRLSLIVALAPLFAAGGCSYQLESMGKSRELSDTTGSIRAVAAPKPLTEMPPEGDLVIARAVVSEVLSKGGKGTSLPWENPKTGARGTITPIASAYSDNGETCQEFLASYIRTGSESWLQGEACRAGGGKWEVRHLKPWQRT
jgi:surface antigen